MQYRKDKYGNEISILGLGCMRFTKNGNTINLKKATKEVAYAIEHGLNYFDTAHLYPGNEVAVGNIIKELGCREKIYIATKLPQYKVKTKDAIDRYFEESLERLQTNYIDYYLMHMLTDIESWIRLKKLGIIEWIGKEKKAGRIRQIGFSFHGNTEMFIKILEDYDWDFCQIQYNYLDEHTQAGRVGLERAQELEIPVIIMEPLRGGKLVSMLPEEAKKKIELSQWGYSSAEWSLRWLWNQEGVTCILSGMNSIEMIKENIAIASKVKVGEFTEKENTFVKEIITIIRSKEKVGCTACGYCMPCPKGIDIPTTFACYNRMFAEDKKTGRREFFQVVSLRKDVAHVSKCVDCGKCEEHCPQRIEIRKKLKEANKALRPFPISIIDRIANWYLLKK